MSYISIFALLEFNPYCFLILQWRKLLNISLLSLEKYSLTSLIYEELLCIWSLRLTTVQCDGVSSFFIYCTLQTSWFDFHPSNSSCCLSFASSHLHRLFLLTGIVFNSTSIFCILQLTPNVSSFSSIRSSIAIGKLIT